MINLEDGKKSIEELKTGISQIDDIGLCAFQNVTVIKNDFHFMSCNRTQEAFRLLQRLCLFNHCDGLVISTADIANQLNVTMRTPYGEKIYFEQTCNINRVLDLINAREKRGIVLIFDFDLYYCNSNGNCVGDNKRIAEYYRDLLCEAVSKSKVAVIAESQYEHCGNYQNAMFVNIDGEEHLLFENGNLAKLHNN